MTELDFLACLLRSGTPCGMASPACAGLRLRRGQALVEYMLMLAVIVSVALMLGIAFHRKFLGGFFTLIGMVIGGGAPS
ncbi:MAG: hypothetical protein FD189_339 [Elusimicrobia bacterium]|nr:MAG: hypothetical protein FD154_419 [Elusimicrobiota bacterium]KAF0157818.1 MAG: hypothetical protein FD189_339 [Elusimicrobiota bacterium]